MGEWEEKTDILKGYFGKERGLWVKNGTFKED